MYVLLIFSKAYFNENLRLNISCVYKSIYFYFQGNSLFDETISRLIIFLFEQGSIGTQVITKYEVSYYKIYFLAIIFQNNIRFQLKLNLHYNLELKYNIIIKKKTYCFISVIEQTENMNENKQKTNSLMYYDVCVFIVFN